MDEMHCIWVRLTVDMNIRNGGRGVNLNISGIFYPLFHVLLSRFIGCYSLCKFINQYLSRKVQYVEH